MSGYVPHTVKLVLLIITAPLAALLSWMLLSQQLRRPDTMQLEFQSDRAVVGRLSWQQAGVSPQPGVNILYSDGQQLTRTTYPISLTFEALRSENPASQSNQVWIYSIRTDTAESSNWQQYPNPPASWVPMFDDGIAKLDAIMFPGGPPQPFTYQTTTTNGRIFLNVLAHPWSGGVRVTVNGRSRDFDLYDPGGVVRILQLSAPKNLKDTSRLSAAVPSNQASLRWNLADQPSEFKLSRMILSGSRSWAWNAGGDIPRLGTGAKLITNTVDGLFLKIDDASNAWVEFNNLPPASHYPTTRYDLAIVAAITGIIWFGMLLVYLWRLVARTHSRWINGAAGAVPLVFLAAIIFIPIVQTTSPAESDKPHFTAEPVVEKLDVPDGIAFGPAGQLFILEKGGFGNDPAIGRVKLVRALGQPPETLLDLPVCANAERGLLGIALDPSFTANGHIYLYYTKQGDACRVDKATDTSPRNRVSRFTLVNNRIALESEVVLVDDIPSVTSAHNAGTLRFGPDGLLYISTGEGATGNNAQDLTSLGGKILRIRPDPNNLVPADNPFANDPLPAKRLIWAYGFRNPFRFNIHPVTSMILVGDVGSEPPRAREELNIVVKGGNYGWPRVEGIPISPLPEYLTPIYAYDHDSACNTIIGGVFITTDAYPAKYRDNFFFGDFSCGRFWRAQIDSAGKLQAISELMGPTPQHPVDFALGPDGRVYYVDISGTIWRLNYTP